MNNTNDPKDQEKWEVESTTTLLRKKQGPPEGDGATAPLTHRLAHLAQEDEAKARKRKQLYIGIGAAWVVVLGVVLLFVFSSGSNGIFSGGSGISASGSNATDSQVFQGKAVPTPDPNAQKPQAAPAKPQPQALPALIQAQAGQQPTSSQQGPHSQVSGPQAPKAAAPAPAPAPAPVRPAPAPAPAPARVEAPKKPAGDDISKGFVLDQQPKVKEGDLVPLSEDVTRPVIATKVNPAYPALAKQMKRNGRVSVQLLVDERGQVKTARVISETPNGFGFGDAAIQAVTKWTFTPARKGGVAVKVWYTVNLPFSIN